MFLPDGPSQLSGGTAWREIPEPSEPRNRGQAGRIFSAEATYAAVGAARLDCGLGAGPPPLRRPPAGPSSATSASGLRTARLDATAATTITPRAATGPRATPPAATRYLRRRKRLRHGQPPPQRGRRLRRHQRHRQPAASRIAPTTANASGGSIPPEPEASNLRTKPRNCPLVGCVGTVLRCRKRRGVERDLPPPVVEVAHQQRGHQQQKTPATVAIRTASRWVAARRAGGWSCVCHVVLVSTLRVIQPCRACSPGQYQKQRPQETQPARSGS